MQESTIYRSNGRRQTEDLLNHRPASMQRTVLITGCSTGFGKVTARHFAEQGWNVIATMRRPEQGAELAAIAGIAVERLDVEDPASIAAAIDAGIARFGRIDALINNAGFGLFGVFEGIPEAKIREQFAVNVFGVMDVTRALLPHFREHRAGVIVNVSSGAGVFALPMLSMYCASKFALEGFSEALSYELGALGIVVKIVEPGGVISTDFGKRSGAEAANVNAIDDYSDFVVRSNEIFADMRTQRLATEEDVAHAIFNAATDGSDRLRYVITEDIKPLVAARRETSEEAYMEFMRLSFGGK
jgi:NAD(P)-dependent dehydrogenase (short-subunit alcohol dehydrogenase family)